MVTLAEELPIAAVVANDQLSRTCSTCFAHKQEAGSMQRCSRCRVINYCSRDCQKKDWANHKFECLFLQKVAPRVPVSLARLMSRIFMKQEYGGGLPMSFNNRTWDHLMDHRQEIQKDPARSEFFICVSHVLYEYMGPEYCPKPADLMTAFGRIVVNCFTITDTSSGVVSLGEGVYVGLSVHDHSCAPDCFILFDGVKALLRSPNRNLKYSPQLTISYTDLMQTRVDRQDALRRQYYFDCKCELCADETRDQWGKSASVICCPDGAGLMKPDQEYLHCYKCGETVGESELYRKSYQELDMFLNKLKVGKDLNEELEKSLAMYERKEVVLSPYNYLMADLCQRILELAFEVNHVAVIRKFATNAIVAYRRYLPPGHPELTSRLMTAAIAASFVEPPTGQTLELFQEAYDASLLSHGPQHSVTSQIDHLLSQYRIRLQRSDAC